MPWKRAYIHCEGLSPGYSSARRVRFSWTPSRGDHIGPAAPLLPQGPSEQRRTRSQPSGFPERTPRETAPAQTFFSFLQPSAPDHPRRRLKPGLSLQSLRGSEFWSWRTARLSCAWGHGAQRRDSTENYDMFMKTGANSVPQGPRVTAGRCYRCLVGGDRGCS